MKITLFTANHARHNSLINILSEVSSELFVIQENETILPGAVQGNYAVNLSMEKYFSKVLTAQKTIFGNSFISLKDKNIIIYSMKKGDLVKCTLNDLSAFLKSDLYIVFGSSYIKGDLADFLIKNKALNIHMGISPYYRGTDCNFWALYDNNPHLVGATIHLLSSGIDSGDILYHAISEIKEDPFEYTMSTVKSAFLSLAEKIKNQSVFEIDTIIQDKSKLIRYSKKIDFTEEVVKSFLSRKINLESPEIDKDLYKSPFVLMP